MPSLRIILMSIFAAVLYGIVHDQITARICVEYFTIGHPPIFHTDDPTLLGIGWGIIATWWVGLLLGIPLAVVSRLGSRPKRSPSSLLQPVGILLAVMGFCAAIAGAIGGLLGRIGAVVTTGEIAGAIPVDRHVLFLVDLWAHGASYLVGFTGGIVLIVITWRSRNPMKS